MGCLTRQLLLKLVGSDQDFLRFDTDNAIPKNSWGV